MILVLGGTTEGRIAIETLEEAGKPYFYSTKGSEQQVPLHHGVRLCGAMDAGGMETFCREQEIRLLVDAAHPFAGQLHRTVSQVADALNLPVIRMERIYPTADARGNITWCRDFDEAIRAIEGAGIRKILAMTGVQTIGKLKLLWADRTCYFRILDRDSSRLLAEKQGFPSEFLCYYRGEDDDEALMHRLSPEAILLKESGESGGFPEKVAAAESLGIRVFAVKRPPIPSSFLTVNGPHGLRRAVELCLPGFFHLRSGLTTGSCATAAAVAAVYSLFGVKTGASAVEITLPDGETIPVPIVREKTANGVASVIKEAGDDPDITNGTEIRASVELASAGEDGYRLVIDGGTGVGRVTLPGLGLEIGAAAINRTPRKMIETNVTRALAEAEAPHGCYSIVISVPEGEKLAARTFNPRLGVVGGISIIGTSGIVRPFSADAFVQSIRRAMEVACASGSPVIVINSGAKSEGFLKRTYPDLPAQAFVHYGNFIGETLKIAHELHVARLVLGMMLGKAVKLAEGNLDTHSKHTVMNRAFIRSVAQEAGCTPPTLSAIDRMALARELWEIIPESGHQAFASRLVSYCYRVVRLLFPAGELSIALLTESGKAFVFQGGEA